ncbi:hypothetical protein EVAR_81092_1 [Eumeta japonica]|uniref:Uncharacterized protein n=1 Tax=Eumeta variegata TaxID=151549 RepID=A0A4C1T946_EUMVA|nr:hypothetical protein EVAR_81092_1 [Eumeta japonica]
MACPSGHFLSPRQPERAHQNRTTHQLKCIRTNNVAEIVATRNSSTRVGRARGAAAAPPDGFFGKVTSNTDQIRYGSSQEQLGVVSVSVQSDRKNELEATQQRCITLVLFSDTHGCCEKWPRPRRSL